MPLLGLFGLWTALFVADGKVCFEGVQAPTDSNPDFVAAHVKFDVSTWAGRGAEFQLAFEAHGCNMEAIVLRPPEGETKCEYVDQKCSNNVPERLTGTVTCPYCLLPLGSELRTYVTIQPISDASCALRVCNVKYNGHPHLDELVPALGNRVVITTTTTTTTTTYKECEDWSPSSVPSDKTQFVTKLRKGISLITGMTSGSAFVDQPVDLQESCWHSFDACSWPFRMETSNMMFDRGSLQFSSNFAEVNQEVRRSHGVDLSAAGQYKGVEGAVTFSHTKTMTEARNMMRYSTDSLSWQRFEKEVKRIYSVFGDDITNVTEVFEQGFINQVKHLKNAMDSNSATFKDMLEGFFRAYGTHFISKAAVGGAATIMIRTDTKGFRQSHSTSIEDCASASVSAKAAWASFLPSVDASYEHCSSSGTSNTRSQFEQFSEQRLFLEGGEHDRFRCGPQEDRKFQFLDSIILGNSEMWPLEVLPIPQLFLHIVHDPLLVKEAEDYIYEMLANAPQAADLPERPSIPDAFEEESSALKEGPWAVWICGQDEYDGIAAAKSSESPSQVPVDHTCEVGRAEANWS
eukprot:Skav207020  [mRNA]  locus=scaffold2740:178792:181502:- [translate_table: standard]